MPNFRQFLSRRWLLAFLGIAVCVFGLVMLHPYPRQSLFGPKIRGKAWCCWEDEIRQAVKGPPKKSPFAAQIEAWLGIKRGDRLLHPGFFSHQELLPLLLKLADDDDEDVRGIAVYAIVYHEELYQEPALPILRQEIQNADPFFQIFAARGIWRISKDKQVIPIVFKVLNPPEAIRLAKPGTVAFNRVTALSVLSEISRELPEFFPDVVAFTNGDDAGMRNAAMGEMLHFGKKGIPLLLNGLQDPDEWVRLRAADTLQTMRAGEKETLAALEGLLLSKDTDIHARAVRALMKIDFERFQHLIK